MTLNFYIGDKEKCLSVCPSIHHLSSVEQVADVLQEGLHLDLCVSEEEDTVRVALRGLAHDQLEVVTPLRHAVALCNLHLFKKYIVTVIESL